LTEEPRKPFSVSLREISKMKFAVTSLRQRWGRVYAGGEVGGLDT
jgi:hypothetical protein